MDRGTPTKLAVEEKMCRLVYSRLTYGKGLSITLSSDLSLKLFAIG